MERYVGLDAHASSCTLGVMTPSGKRVGSHVVETNARCLIEAVRQIPQPRHICLEEGTLSEWLYEVLSPHAEKVVAAAVGESRGPKDDRRDAFGLAEGLRLGAIKRKVYKERGGFGALGYHAKGYRWIRSDGVRVRNRPIYRHYLVLLDGGTKPNLAKLTIARQIASIVLAVWRTKEAYDPKRLESAARRD